MKFSRTLRFRLTLLFSITLTILSVAILTFLLRSVEARLMDEVDALISERIEYFTSFIDEELDDGHHSEIAQFENEIFESLMQSPLQKEAYILISEESGVVFIKTLDDKLALLKSEELGQYEGGEFLTIKVDAVGYPLRFYAQEVFDDHQIVIVTSLEFYEKQVANIRLYFISAAILLVLTGALIAWLTVGRSMKGVLLVSGAADEFGGGNLKKRVDCHGDGSEIEHLADSFNIMASQVETLIFEMKDVTNNIAHDLRTPVTRMRGIAENALQSEDSKTIELAAKIIEECEHQAKIIEDILNLAESESGALELDLKEENLNEMLIELVELFQPFAEEVNCKVELHLPEKDLVASLDRSRLQRALSNILDNALKYGGGEIDIIAFVKDEKVSIRISDKGAGIPQDIKEKVFKRFFRADSSRHTKGTGLGLSLARAYLHNHNGELVLADSKVGASFLIELPL